MSFNVCVQLKDEVAGLAAGASKKRSLDMSIDHVVREASAELKAAVKECLDNNPDVKAAAKAALDANPDAAAAAPQLAALVNAKREGESSSSFSSSSSL